jgi:glycosyltransferase involved in cell wall biosynthesis
LSPRRTWNELARLDTMIEQLTRHLQTRSDELAGQIAVMRRELQQDLGSLRYDGRADRILATMLWIQSVEVAEDTLVSVVTATWNRSAKLMKAIQSLLAQTYSNWELVIVDDGSTDDTEAQVKAVGDPRIRLIQAEHGGLSKARNRGLTDAKGSMMAYLDDDNTLHSEWIRSVAWAFQQQPEVDVLYGAHVRQTDRLLMDVEPAGLPAILFRPFDRQLLEQYSYIDVGSVAHRAGMPEAHFDESLSVAGDYDLILRLTRDKPALALPVIACLYHMGGQDRLSAVEAVEDEVRRIRATLRR